MIEDRRANCYSPIVVCVKKEETVEWKWVEVKECIVLINYVFEVHISVEISAVKC